jgi:hypothetical protein
VSDDQRAGAPSFGDLFDDPESPLAPPPAPTPSSGSVTVSAPAASRPTADDVAAHDLDHESAEASHLVAGFEHDDEPDDDVPISAADDVVAHDLDHESAEAGHLVAGFEHDDEPDQPVGAGSVSVPAADDVRPATVAAAGAGVSVAAAPWDGTVDPSISSAPAGRVDTGRLYRSAGAEGPATLDAIPAIDPDRVPPRTTAVPVDEPTRRSAGLTYSGVVVVVMAATVVAAFVEALARHEIGWITGVALLASSVYSALVVRRPDIWAAVVVPPLAFLVAALTAGQLTLGKSGGLLVRQGVGLFQTLAVNAPWVLGTTLICLVIVLVRRRREPL